MTFIDHLIINHAPWSFALAAGVSLLSGHTTFQLLRQGRAAGEAGRVGWAMLAAAACAVGVWSTHFIAMLGYVPHKPIGFDPWLTLGSVGVIGIVAGPVMLACVSTRGPFRLAGAGAVLGLGIAGMHYTGMAGVRLPGAIEWDPATVAGSVLLGAVFGALALPAFVRRRRKGGKLALVPVTLLTLATVLMHFTGMAAVTMVPGEAGEPPAGDLPRIAIAATVAVGVLLIVGLGTVAIVARRLRLMNLQLRRRNRARSEQFHTALSNMSQGLTMYDSQNRLTVSNRRYCELTGVAPTVMQPGRHFREVLEANKALGNFGGGVVEEILGERMRLLERGEAANLTQQMANGLTIRVHFSPMPSGGWVATYSDITEQTRTEEHIRYLAHHDPLTDLPNRTKFMQVLDRSLAEMEGELAVLFLDLDGFKAINDTMGHPNGDRLLSAVAGRLRKAARSSDTVARLGGDEFALVQRGEAGGAAAVLLATRVIEALSADFGIEGQRVQVRASLGIALAPQDGTTSEALLRRADIALYAAKAEGGGCFRYFEVPMEAPTVRTGRVGSAVAH